MSDDTEDFSILIGLTMAMVIVWTFIILIVKRILHTPHERKYDRLKIQRQTARENARILF